MSLKFVVLTLINKKPQTGYEIVKTFDSAVGYFWHASHQQVYRELGQLADAQLVSFKVQQQEERPDKKIYRVTAQGRKALKLWLETPLKRAGVKDALLVKLLSTEWIGNTVLLGDIEREIQHSRSLLSTYKSIETRYYSAGQLAKLAASDRILYLALRKGILGIEAHLTWLSEAVETVKDVKSEV